MQTVAVVGLGHWGMRHVATLCELIGSAQILGVDPDASARTLAQRYGVECTSDLEQMPLTIRHVVIATPNETHADLATTLLSRDIDVLVEKPLADNEKAAASVVELAATRQRELMVGHIYLFSSGHRALRSVAARFGAIRFIRLERYTPGYVKGESGAWCELAPHELAVALDLGAIRERPTRTLLSRWSATGIGHEDGASAQLMTSTSTVHIDCSWLSAFRARRVWVVAEGGQALLLDDGIETRLGVWGGTAEWQRERPSPQVWQVIHGPAPLESELRAFLSGEGSRWSGGSLGLEVVRLSDQVVGGEQS